MAKERWTADNLPSQEGRVIIVTGSTSGIGFEAARQLAIKGATVIMAVRNEDKGRKAADEITRQGASSPDTMRLDLADLASVRSFADAFRRKYSRLDILINNAGVMIPPLSRTADDFELQIGTNHLGHFALTGLLFDMLKATNGSRIVTVSSVAHKQGNINFDDLNWEKRPYKAWQAYGDSKIANLYFTFELARKCPDTSQCPIIAAAHPGWTATDLQRHSGMLSFLNNFLAQSIAMGALPTLYAAVEPHVHSGDYIGAGGIGEIWGYPRKVSSSKRSRDTSIAARLWTVSEQLTGVHFPD